MLPLISWAGYPVTCGNGRDVSDVGYSSLLSSCTGFRVLSFTFGLILTFFLSGLSLDDSPEGVAVCAFGEGLSFSFTFYLQLFHFFCLSSLSLSDDQLSVSVSVLSFIYILFYVSFFFLVMKKTHWNFHQLMNLHSQSHCHHYLNLH